MVNRLPSMFHIFRNDERHLRVMRGLWFPFVVTIQGSPSTSQFFVSERERYCASGLCISHLPVHTAELRQTYAYICFEGVA